MRVLKGIAGPILVAAGVVLLGASQAAPALGADYTLRISTVINASDPLYKGYERLAESVAERTGGKLEIEVFADGVLGQDEDVMEQALLGADIAFNTDAGRLGQRVNELGIVLAPYLFEHPDDAGKLFSSDLFQGWLSRLENEHGLTVLAFNYYVGGRHFLTDKPILTPADLAGMRIRTPGAPVWQESVRALGATPVALPWIETYPALQQGVIDGAEAQHPASFGAKLFEVASHISKTGHILLINGPVVGTAWFRSLPEEYQVILREEAAAAGAWTTEQVLALEADFEAQMVAGGATVHQPDVEAFRVASLAAYDALQLTDVRAQVEAILEADE